MARVHIHDDLDTVHRTGGFILAEAVVAGLGFNTFSVAATDQSRPVYISTAIRMHVQNVCQ